ncbi:MAG: four helix bundle protein [Kiritimatiellae bacterium]|nr:four helix bundle protein [Kiritimatiellia bacterium]
MSKSLSSPNGGYRWLDVWALASVIQLGTQRFCLRHLDRRNDPCGRLHDQMAMAARSVPANIAEGYARRSTSAETQLRLYDVARASLAELAGDYRNFLLFRRELPWSESDPEERAVFGIPLDRPDFTADVERASAAHVLAQYDKFARWLDAPDPLVSARALLVLVARAILMLSAAIDRTHADFLANGGFTETLSRERIAARAAAPAPSDAPSCPLCGKPMQKRLAKRGPRAGRPFWSCPDYPSCNGSRSA